MSNHQEYSKMTEDEFDNGDSILICVDSCEHSLRAFNWYHQYLHRANHKVHLIHVYERPTPRTSSNNYDISHDAEKFQKDLEKEREASEAITSKFQLICAQRSIKCHVYNAECVENSGQTIVEFIKRNHIGCVVMGQRGLGAFKRKLFGSVSEHVLHHGHVTVLIVPPPKGHKCIST